MKKLVQICGLSLLLNMVICFCFAESPLMTQKQMQTILDKAMPAVVNIACQGEFSFITDPFLKRELEQMQNGRFPDKKQFSSIGSGVIIDAKQGLIVTNAHVINQAKTISVTLNDGRRYKAEAIGTDDLSDIALLQIHADNIKDIPLANSNELKIGDFVAAIGSPFGLNQTVTSGIVSGLHRTGLGIEGVENFIQTDAPINMGNSGGALINIQGKLVGINTALLSEEGGGNIGIGFAIPSNMVKSIVQQIILYGKVHRGLLGILVQTVTPDLAEALHSPNTEGAIVAQIVPGSSAEKGGLKVGDIITQIDQEKIKTSGDVHNAISLIRIGKTVTLTILRAGKTLTLSMKTMSPSDDVTTQLAVSPYLVGVKMTNTVELSSEHGYVQGVKILTIDPYSAAWLAGLRPHDIIVSANQKPITNIQELENLAKPSSYGLLLNIFRKEGAGFIVIKNGY